MMEDDRRDAVRAVEKRIQLFENTARLDPAAIDKYRHRDVAEGWSLLVAFEGGARENLYLLLDNGFPFTKPIVAVSATRFLQWPHVEADGVLCPLPDSSTVDPFSPVAVVERLLGDAATLVEACLKGQLTDDFRSEFYSYWNRTIPQAEPDVVSIISSFGESRLLTLWRGKHFYLVANDELHASAWLRRRFSDNKKHSFEAAALVTIERPLLPTEYPNNGRDVLGLVRPKQAEKQLLQKLIRGGSSPALIIIAAPTASGPAMAPIQVSVPNHIGVLGRKSAILERGFRPGHVPEALQLERFFAPEAKARRLKLERADAAWVHGRGQNAEVKNLQSCKVVIFGVGSVGGYLAEKLASAGVGYLDLVDAEDLTFANAGRHILGVDSAGKSKALAVAELLCRRFPHCNVTGHRETAQEFLRELSTKAQNFDLAISAVGEWSADSYLNEWRLSHYGDCQNILFGWLEAHALVGHAVLISQKESCLKCHFDDTGIFDFQLTDWPAPTQLPEPACGGLFQPYGPVDLGFTVSMIASLALDHLRKVHTQSTHRFYVSSEEAVHSLGGQWTESSRDLRKGLPRASGAIVTLPWRPNPRCPRCRRSSA